MFCGPHKMSLTRVQQSISTFSNPTFLFCVQFDENRCCTSEPASLTPAPLLSGSFCFPGGESHLQKCCNDSRQPKVRGQVMEPCRHWTTLCCGERGRGFLPLCSLFHCICSLQIRFATLVLLTWFPMHLLCTDVCVCEAWMCFCRCSCHAAGWVTKTKDGSHQFCPDGPRVLFQVSCLEGLICECLGGSRGPWVYDLQPDQRSLCVCQNDEWNDNLSSKRWIKVCRKPHYRMWFKAVAFLVLNPVEQSFFCFLHSFLCERTPFTLDLLFGSRFYSLILKPTQVFYSPQLYQISALFAH